MLRTDQLHKQRKGHSICSEISLQVQERTITALIGSNGAGKSTTFQMLAGLTFPTKGRIFLNNQDITHQPLYLRARHGIGYLPQQTSVFEYLSVYDNILAVAELNPKTPDAESQRQSTEKLLEDFQLTHIAHTLAMQVSGGEKRRTEIARMLAASPSYILLDEPFAGVDPKSIAEIKNLIRILKQERGLGVLISDHNARETLDLADYVYVMHQGRILAHGTSAEVSQNPLVLASYLGQI